MNYINQILFNLLTKINNHINTLTSYINITNSNPHGNYHIDTLENYINDDHDWRQSEINYYTDTLISYINI